MEESGIVSLDEASEAGIDVYDQERINEVIVLSPFDEDDLNKNYGNILFKPCLGL